MNSDDKSWLEGLAGRDDDAPAAREGRLLRQAMQRRAVGKVHEPERSETREAELIARATGEGEPIREPRAKGRAFPLSWLFGGGGMLALASVAILAIAVSFLMPVTVTDEETLRGAPGSEQRISSDDPAALRLGITEALLDAGIEVESFSMLGDEFIAADLPQPLPPQVAAVLDRFGVPVPANGELRLRISTREE